MNKDNYNKQALTDFLLGALPENDAERFAEFSITDDDFADVLQSAENDLVDSYIHGELKNPQLAKFEAFYLASPRRREKVNFARTLQVVAEKYTAETSPTVEKKQPFWADLIALRNSLANFNPAWRFGFAALVLAFIGIFGWLLVSSISRHPIEEAKVSPPPLNTPVIQSSNAPPINTPPTTPTVPTPQVSPTVPKTEKLPEIKKVVPKPTPPPVEPIIPQKPNMPIPATFILLPPVRGGNSLQTVVIPAKTTVTAFKLPLEINEFKSYRIALTNQAGKTLWQSGKVRAKKNALNVRFPAKLLQSNIYSFAVSGINEAGEAENIGNYSFRSVLK